MKEFRKAYRKDHPLALWFSLSVAAVAAQALIFPATNAQSPQTLALGPVLTTIFYIVWLGSGALSAYGLCRANFKAEAGGMMLLGFSFLAYGAIIIYLLGLERGSWIFLMGLGFGCIQKSYHLVKLTNPLNHDDQRPY